MDIKLTTKEFRYLLDLVYVGNWILNSTRGNDRFEEYDDLQEKFFTLPFYSENAGSCEPAFYVDFDYTRAAVIMAIL